MYTGLPDWVPVTGPGGPGSMMVTRADTTLYDVQCLLNASGASELVVDLVISSSSSPLFLETVQLGIALLEGGNGIIQVGPACMNAYSFVSDNILVHKGTLAIMCF